MGSFILLKWKCSRFNFLFLTSITKYSIFVLRYMDSVPLIIPLLEKEYRRTTRKLNEINQELRFVLQISDCNAISFFGLRKLR